VESKPPVLLKLRNKGIHQEVCESRTISFNRNTLSKQNQPCNLSLEATSTMLPSHPAVASVSLDWETEGLSLTFQDFEMDNTMMEMDLMDELGAGIKEFNTGSSQINTPDISPDTFEYVFTETGEAGNLIATETFEDVEYSTLTETELNTANAKDFTEHIWGHNTFEVFETPELGLCAPANVVEGAAEELQPQEAASPALCHSNDPLEFENLDLLQWIVNDQDITIETEEPKQEVPHQVVERVSVIVPVVSQQFRIEPLEVKTENLSEDEKYRRMRDQNNEASKRCRANRKRKHQDTDEELERLQERNVVLRAQMDQMEREVKELKSKFLSDITISKKFN